MNEQIQVVHWRYVWFDSSISAVPDVDDRWEINGAQVAPELLTGMVAKLAPALEAAS